MSGQRTPVSLIAEGKDYALLASDDKSCFILRSKADFYAAHLRGDDAVRFGTDYDAVRRQFPDWQPDQTLAQLWDQGGYSWLASKEAE